MTSRRLGPLVALAMAVLICAGCGSKAPAENSSTKSSTANRDKATKFAECMRDNGVSEFPDPDASGQMTIDGVVNGSSIDPNGPAWKRAIAACKNLQPSGFTGPKKRSPKQQSASLEFAQCIREHGVKDFPDPTDGEPLVNTNHIPSTASGNGMAILNAAMRKCGELGAKAGASRP